jgi:hypothetical protein
MSLMPWLIFLKLIIKIIGKLFQVTMVFDHQFEIEVQSLNSNLQLDSLKTELVSFET